MSNIMNQTDVKNNAHRNGFDLSHKIAFTSQSGMLLPVYSEQLLPGDSFNIQLSSFTRTQPVNTAAYTRIKEYFDFYFVPLHLLWSRAPQCIAQTNDLQQWNKASLPYGNDAPYVPTSFPSFPTQRFETLLGYLGGSANLSSKLEPYFGFSSYFGAVRLLEHLNYGFRLQKNGDNWEHIHPINTPVNLWRLCAYQKIYNDWFRFSQWEPSEPWTFNLDYYDDDPTGFQNNWQLTCGPMVQNNRASMLTLRYAPWKKDLFTGVLPSPQFGNAAAVDVDSVGEAIIGKSSLSNRLLGVSNQSKIIGYNYSQLSNPVGATETPLDSFNNMTYAQGGYRIAKIGTDTTGFLSGDANVKGAFTILQLRMAEAQQKWAEITQSGRLDYKSQMQKHFGVTPDDALAHRSEYIGGVSSVLDINEVVNANLTGDADANLAGKGVGTSQGHFKYTAKEHGILMCIYHNEPILDYGSNVFDKQNQEVSPNDLPIPEYDSIGMDAVYLHQLIGDDPFNNGTILGYAPRYIHYKTRVDKVLGAFNGSLSSWVTPLSQSYLRELLYGGSPTHIWAMKLGFFHVNPAILNPIFGVNADTSPNTDQFLHNVFFDIKAARNLDRNGLPY